MAKVLLKMICNDFLPTWLKVVTLTLCGLTGQQTHQGGPGLGGSVHEEAHPCFPYFAQIIRADLLWQTTSRCHAYLYFYYTDENNRQLLNFSFKIII